MEAWRLSFAAEQNVGASHPARVLLVNPNQERAPEPVPPVGLCQVATATAAAGHDVRVLDLCFARRPRAKLRKTLRRLRPQVVGLTVRNVDNADARAPRFYLDDLRALADEVRDAIGAPPVLGGSGLTMDPERVMRHLGARYAVLGAAENAFADLLAFLEAGAEGPLPAAVARLTNGRYSPAASGADWVEFADSVFNWPRDHALRIAEAIRRSGVSIKLRSSLTPRGVDLDLARALREAGFAASLCSPDTAHPATLEGYGKSFTRRELERLAGAAPLRPTPDAFFLASGLDAREVDEAADAAARECSHVLHMDSGRGVFVGLSRWVLAALRAEIPAFRVPAVLRGDRL